MGVEVCTPQLMQTAVEVHKCQDVVAIANDKNARGNAYVVTDALGAAVLCTQRLPVAASVAERKRVSARQGQRGVAL